MDTKVSYTLVGTFVILLSGAIVLCIIWLSSDFSLQRYSTYLVLMQESVSGLNYDSPVEYNGVRVGTVKDIELNPKNPQLVKVLLSISNSAPITRATVATLNTRGLTGVTYVALKDTGQDLRPLSIIPGQKYAIIPNAPSIFMRLDTALNEITKNVHEVSYSIQTLLNKENLANFKKILINMQTFTATLAENNAVLTQIMKNTANASRQMGPFFRSGNNAMRAIETQTIPAAYQMLTNIDEATRTLGEIAAELRQNPSMLIRGVDNQALGPGESK